MTTEAGSLRDPYNDFVARHEVAWELGMAAITLVWLVVSFASEGSSRSVSPEAMRSG